MERGILNSACETVIERQISKSVKGLSRKTIQTSPKSRGVVKLNRASRAAQAARRLSFQTLKHQAGIRAEDGVCLKEDRVTESAPTTPDIQVAVRDVFGIDSDLQVPAFSERTDHVPEVDTAYRFNPDVTLAVLAGFAHDRRVMVQGRHGTGKSTHIEQIAARLNWPCVRVNLDGHISRLDLVGKDTIVIEDGRQV